MSGRLAVAGGRRGGRFCGGGGRCVCWAGPGFFVGPDKFAVCSTLNTRQKCYFFSFLHI